MSGEREDLDRAGEVAPATGSGLAVSQIHPQPRFLTGWRSAAVNRCFLLISFYKSATATGFHKIKPDFPERESWQIVCPPVM